jgi:hypothetical protein
MTIALITITPLAIVQMGESFPRLTIPGVGDVYGATPGWTSGNFKVVSVTIVGTPTDQFSQLQSEVLSLTGDVLTVTRTYTQRAAIADELVAYASTKQQQMAASGTSLGAVPIPTDPTTLNLLSLAYTKALATPAFTMNWLSPTGSPDEPSHLNVLTLNATNIQNAAQQVGNFLADTLARKATAVAGINAGTITTVAQIDAIFAA